MGPIDELIWTQGATADLQVVYNWVEEREERQGDLLLERVDAALAPLHEFPELAPRFGQGTLRRRLVGKNREYGIFYQFAGRRIIVVAFLDLRQAPEKLREILRSRGVR